MYLTKIPTLSIMNALQNHDDQEIISCQETNKYYHWNGNAYEETVAPGSLNLNLYEINKNIMSQMNSLTHKQLIEAKNLIKSYQIRNSFNSHYMLLCRENNYYTIFEKNNNSNSGFANEVISIASELGDILSVEENNNNAIEIWIKFNNEEVNMFILFPYDAGVVYYG